MEQDKQSMTNPEQGPSFSVITVPEQLREQVLEFVKQLKEDVATHGLNMSEGATGGTGTDCKWTQTVDNKYEVICSDVIE
ncbi:MAG: hypothetical protein WBW04_21105 [Nitrolancea sp.]